MTVSWRGAHTPTLAPPVAAGSRPKLVPAAFGWPGALDRARRVAVVSVGVPRRARLGRQNGERDVSPLYLRRDLEHSGR